MRAVLDDPAERELHIFERPQSAIRQKLNYSEFISSLKQADCNAALKRITPRIQLQDLHALVESTPFLTDLQREVYTTMLIERKDESWISLCRSS